MSKLINNKRGSMLMTVIVMLIVAGIIAMQLMPDAQTEVRREDESFYNSDLSQLREAIDLVRLAAKDPNNIAVYNNPLIPDSGWLDFTASDTAASISEKIASLSAWGFLRKKDVRDNSVPEVSWGQDKIFWVVSSNYASNTSFELNIPTIDPTRYLTSEWEKQSTASATVTNSIKMNTMAIDEYPFQNKLGDATRGENAIQMIRIDR